MPVLVPVLVVVVLDVDGVDDVCFDSAAVVRVFASVEDEAIVVVVVDGVVAAVAAPAAEVDAELEVGLSVGFPVEADICTARNNKRA